MFIFDKYNKGFLLMGSVIKRNEFMVAALVEAQKALSEGEIPVGCIITFKNEIIARGRNKREQCRNALGHAEISAIDEACKKLSDWRLSECDLYVTLEPCMMCAGAILNARIRRLYFGAYASKENYTGYSGVGSVEEILLGVHDRPEIYGGICEEECEEILKTFFNRLRKNGKRGDNHEHQ